MSRYALTGATGFVGGAVARRLIEGDHEVVALVRDPTRAGDLAAKGASLIPGDLGDIPALDDLCRDTDGLFHIAGWYKVGSPDHAQARRVNVDGTRAVLDAAHRAGVPRVVYTSTLAVNSDTGGAIVDETYRFTGSHLSIYDETKAAAHDLVRTAAADGLPAVTVMPGLVYGRDDTSQAGALIDDVASGRRPLVPSGGRLCWAHVDDIADGHIVAMENGTVGQDYMLAGPPASLAEGLTLVATLAGTRGPRVVPDAVLRAAGRAAGVFGALIPTAAGFAESARVGLATYLGDSTKARTELGWTCRSMDQGLAVLTTAPAKPRRLG